MGSLREAPKREACARFNIRSHAHSPIQRIDILAVKTQLGAALDNHIR